MVDDAIVLMLTGEVYFATLGSDDGIWLIRWMAERNIWPQMINIHATGIGNVAKMKLAIEKYSTLYVHTIRDNDGWGKPLGVYSWKKVR